MDPPKLIDSGASLPVQCWLRPNAYCNANTGRGRRANAGLDLSSCISPTFPPCSLLTPPLPSSPHRFNVHRKRAQCARDLPLEPPIRSATMHLASTETSHQPRKHGDYCHVQLSHHPLGNWHAFVRARDMQPIPPTRGAASASFHKSILSGGTQAPPTLPVRPCVQSPHVRFSISLTHCTQA